MITPKGMTVISLDVKNVMRIKAISIKPDQTGGVIIGGKNGNGKSSVLNAICYALGGKDLVCDEPLRRGAVKGEIELDLGEFIVTRRFTKANPRGIIEVRARDKSIYPSPQTLLDALCGKLGFDPSEFMRLDSKAQGEMLRQLVGLDLSAFDSRRAALAEQRREIGARIKTGEAVIAAGGMDESEIEALAAAAPPDTSSMRIELEKCQSAQDEKEALRAKWQNIQVKKSNVGLETLREKMISLAETKLGIEHEITALHEKIQKIDSAISENLAKQETATSRAAELQALSTATEELIEEIIIPDAQEISERIRIAQDVAREIEKAKKMMDRVRAVRCDRAALDQTTDAIRATDDAKRAAIAAAHYPIDGLAVTEDGGVEYNRLPLRQASSAEQLRVSLAIAIAANPTIRVITIRNGNDLDSDNLAVVCKMAEASGHQVWIERVSDDADEVSFLIEDGEIADGDEEVTP